MTKSNSCQPCCLRSDSSFNSPIMNQRSSVPRGQHWPQLRIGTCGRRLRPLNTSTMVPQLLPQDCNNLEESFKEAATRDKSTSRARVSNGFSASTTPHFIMGHIPRRHQYTRQCCSKVRRSREWHRHHAHEQGAPSRDRTGLPTVASNHLVEHFSGSDTRVEQEARDQTSNSSSVGPCAKCEINAELGRGQHLVTTRLMIGSYSGPALQQLQGTLRDAMRSIVQEQCSLIETEEIRRTVEEWAEQTETAWSACQTHNRAQFLRDWWPARKCLGWFGC